MKEEYDIKLLLREIESYKGDNTELVSLYIPPDRDLNKVRSRVSNEYSEAQNIKTKETRKNVQTALSGIKSILNNYENVPKNGMVIFCGSVDGNVEKYVIDNPPEKIDFYKYHCDSEFHVSPLKELIKNDTLYGIIAVDRKNAQIGKLEGNSVIEMDSLSSRVPGKHNKGGQSNERFDRIIEEKKDNFFKKVAEIAEKNFLKERHDLDGILLGGPSPSRKDFKRQEFLHHELQEKIVSGVDISDTKDKGLKEIVEKSSDIIKERENLEKKQALSKFFKNISKDDKAVYGLEETLEAIEYGAVEKLLISEDVDYEIEGDSAIRVLSDKTEQKGGEAILIPTDIEKGSQFHKAFGGVGAILRYNY